MPPLVICQLLLQKGSVCFSRHRHGLRLGLGAQPQAVPETDGTKAPASLAAHLHHLLTIFLWAVSRAQANRGSQHVLPVTSRAS